MLDGVGDLLAQLQRWGFPHVALGAGPVVARPSILPPVLVAGVSLEPILQMVAVHEERVDRVVVFFQSGQGTVFFDVLTPTIIPFIDDN